MAACRKCGEKLDIPTAMVTGPRPPPPKKEPARREISQLELATMTASKAVATRQKRVRKKHRIIAWSPSSVTILIMFFVITGILCLLRYVILGNADLDIFVKAGLFMMLVGYLTVVVDGFGDSIMNGLLCLVVPFYFLYYLYSECDSWALRLLVGVLVPPFAPNAVMACYGGVMSVVGMMKSSM